ncbi:hypothetical protein Bca4012_006145 [Brassica carinata]|uniref:(rape) hypothetical protein n=1 Tax=Brassica napus TaxID=3708 RepID=A0A816IPI4_BRANA|nr:unnamed protein product [Brassica napus]
MANSQIHLSIFVCMDHNLYQITQEREQRPFSEGEISTFMAGPAQMLQGLAHMHKNSYFHRQLKPENLLVTSNILKIADFGLAGEVASVPPQKCRTSLSAMSASLPAHPSA